MPSKHLLISIIIPVYNGSQTIGRCLKRIFESSRLPYECIVIDDQSKDNTVGISKSFPTKTISVETRRGAAYARNFGAELATGDILLFVDADVLLPPDCLEKVSRVFESSPDISALFGSYDDRPGHPGFVSQYKNLFHHYIHQTSQENASTFWSGCGAVRKEVFQAVGGFDQNKYSASCIEDIEMGYRLKEMGYEILLYKDLQVTHLKYFSFLGLLKSDIFDRAIPWTVLMLNSKKVANDLNLKIGHKLSAITVILLIFSAFMVIKSMWFILGFLCLLIFYFSLNIQLYRFFLKKRGYFFTLKVIPLQLLYYLYSTGAFLAGFCKYLFEKHRHKLEKLSWMKSVD